MQLQGNCYTLALLVTRYITCLKGKMHSENLLRSDMGPFGDISVQHGAMHTSVRLSLHVQVFKRCTINACKIMMLHFVSAAVGYLESLEETYFCDFCLLVQFILKWVLYVSWIMHWKNSI